MGENAHGGGDPRQVGCNVHRGQVPSPERISSWLCGACPGNGASPPEDRRDGESGAGGSRAIPKRSFPREGREDRRGLFRWDSTPERQPRLLEHVHPPQAALLPREVGVVADAAPVRKPADRAPLVSVGAVPREAAVSRSRRGEAVMRPCTFHEDQAAEAGQLPSHGAGVEGFPLAVGVPSGVDVLAPSPSMSRPPKARTVRQYPSPERSPAAEPVVEPPLSLPGRVRVQGLLGCSPCEQAVPEESMMRAPTELKALPCFRGQVSPSKVGRAASPSGPRQVRNGSRPSP